MRRSRRLQEKEEEERNFDGVSEPQKKKTRKEKQPPQPARNDEANENNYLLNLDLLPLELVLKQATLTTVLALGRTCKLGKERVNQYFRQCGPVDRVREDVKLFRKLEDAIDRSDGNISFEWVRDFFGKACRGGHILTLNTVLAEHARPGGVNWSRWAAEIFLEFRLGILTAYRCGHGNIVPLIVHLAGISKSQFVFHRESWTLSCFDAACKTGHVSVVKWCCEHFCIERADIDPIKVLAFACESGRVEAAAYVTSRFDFSRDQSTMAECLTLLTVCPSVPIAQWVIETFQLTALDIKDNMRRMCSIVRIFAKKRVELFDFVLRRFDISERELRKADEKLVADVLNSGLFCDHCLQLLKWVKENWTLQQSDFASMMGSYNLAFICVCEKGQIDVISYFFDGLGWSPRQHWDEVEEAYLHALGSAIAANQLTVVRFLIERAHLFQANDPGAHEDREFVQEKFQRAVENEQHDLVKYLVDQHGFKTKK